MTNTATPVAQFEPGTIFYVSWGYEQTNINFFRVTKIDAKPSGTWVTFEELQSRTHTYDDGTMTGFKVPGDVLAKVPLRRRKVRDWSGGPSFLVFRGYGSASLWDGKPLRFSSYG